MGFANFKRNIWAAAIEMALQKVLVFQSVANTNYEGNLVNLGDEVTILTVGNPTAKAYTSDADIAAPEKLSDAAQKLKADKAYYFNFAVNDVDANQAKQQLLTMSTNNAAYAFADEVDKYMAGLHEQAGLAYGTAAAPIDITSLSVDEAILASVEAMHTANIPRAARKFMVVPEWFYTKLVIAGLATKTSNDALYDNSVVDRRHGVDIIVSNNVSHTTAATKQGAKIIMGVYQESFTYAGVISSVEAYRPEKRFEDAVKGLYIFGGKCVRPDKTLVLHADYTDEA